MAPDLSSSAHCPAVSHTDFCTYAGKEKKKLNAIFVCLCLIRGLSQMCARVSLGFSPCCRRGCILCHVCVPDIGRKLLGLFMWRSDVCSVGEIFHIPFGRHWPSTLKAGAVSQVQHRLLTLPGLTLTQKHAVCSQFYFTFVCFCECVFAWAGQISFLKDIIISLPCRLDCSCDKRCDEQKIWNNRKWVRQMLTRCNYKSISKIDVLLTEFWPWLPNSAGLQGFPTTLHCFNIYGRVKRNQLDNWVAYLCFSFAV